MQTRSLGTLKTSAIGLGCMGFSHGYGAIPDEIEAVELIRKAYELGCTFYDTAEGYGQGHNEILVGKAIKPFREKVTLATKFRVTRSEAEEKGSLLSAIRVHLNDSLKRLNTEYIDLYYLHRVNPEIPIENIAACMKELCDDQIIRGWGMSQVSVDKIQKAHAIMPLSAIQSEYSMMERSPENDVIPACAELSIGFVPFSPLASGFLSGKVTRDMNYSGDDVRRVITRFDKDNIDANQPLLDLLYHVAEKNQATPAQISLAWMLHKYPHLVPIPGMRKQERIKENLSADDVLLTDEEFYGIEQALTNIEIYGNRTDEDISKLKNIT